MRHLSLRVIGALVVGLATVASCGSNEDVTPGRSGSGGAAQGGNGGTSGSGGVTGGGGGGSAGSGGVTVGGGGAAGTGGTSGDGGGAGTGGTTAGAGGAGGSGGTGGTTGGTGGTTGGTGGSTVIPTGPLVLDWKLDANAGPTACPTFATLATHPNPPKAMWGTVNKAPLPTNKWWVGITQTRKTTNVPPAQDILVPFPYQVAPSDPGTGLKVGFPHTTQDNWAIKSAVSNWITLGGTGAATFTIKEFDDLSVSLTWTGTGGSMYAPLVTGMPYATMVYAGMTPVITGITLNGTGKRFEGTVGAEKWAVYTSQDVTFTNGTASAPLTGWVRVAMLPDAAATTVIDAHAAAIPKRAKVDFGTAAGNLGVIQITWDTEGSGEPLMMALPHHIPRLADQAKLQPVTMNTVIGDSKGVEGQLWQVAYQLTDVSFRPPRAIEAGRLAAIKTALAADSSWNPAASGGTYTSGKELGKLARLAIIADEVGDTANRDTLLGRLKSKEAAWLDATNSGDKLNYDKTWGGVVSQCIAGGNLDCDYGQGNYNDHHFHYGYHAYAAAVAAKLDPAWGTQYKEKGTWLVRDYANPYRNDPCFTRLRNFDAYVSHSWAMGLWASWNYGEGRNQESSSEAVNAYYGMQLWGEATGNTDLAKVGKILRIAESVGAMTYYQIRKPSTIYAAPFATAHPCVGYMFGSQPTWATFFGGGADSICGIQLIPVTPASEDFVGKEWAAERWTDLQAIAGGAGNGWRNYYLSALANSDKAKGCTEIEAQTQYDNGNSRANMLHYCATRP
jgi:endo-1,3(4)-beta-glucanase